jgi:hypothetical protein
MPEPKYQVEYRSLDRNGVPCAKVARIFPVSKWEHITEADALSSARRYANDVRHYHMFVDVVRVGPRGGRKAVA